MSDDEEKFLIEIAYATPERQVILEQQVAPGTTARAAVLQSDIDQYFDTVDKQKDDLGVFGKAVKDDYELQPGDRIEIYRPLKADPKEVRKRRAAEGKAMKKGGGDAAETAAAKA
jgi:putative ubiquitin-RnfH superfamily antitoxin RatB of RatAB toxin-antitoxin module